MGACAQIPLVAFLQFVGCGAGYSAIIVMLLIGLNRRCFADLFVVLGAIAGIVAFLPYVIALRAQRNVTETSHFSHMSILVLAVLGSSAVLFGSVLACIALHREGALAFAGGEAGAIIVVALAFGIWKVLLRNKDKGSSKKG